MIRVKRDKRGPSVWINDKEMPILDHDGEHVWAECTLEDLKDETVYAFPECLMLSIHNDDGFGTYLFYDIDIMWHRNGVALDFNCHEPNKYWNGRFGLGTFLSAIQDQATFLDNLVVSHIELEDDHKSISLGCVVFSGHRIYDSIMAVADQLNHLVRLAEVALAGLIWKKEYETDEAAFCKEVLYPLLLRMKFCFVRYGHGTKEYGKDFTFSEPTRFGDFRHYGLQAKAGDVSGEVNSKVDELLGQAKDAFEMPYYELGSKDPRYISSYVIAVSGRFTENAREKIVEKIPKLLVGSVYFLDRQRIEELVLRYWHKR
jgi:hypothetical protein